MNEDDTFNKLRQKITYEKLFAGMIEYEDGEPAQIKFFNDSGWTDEDFIKVTENKFRDSRVS